MDIEEGLKQGDTRLVDLYECFVLELINKFKKCRNFDSESFNRAQNLFQTFISYRMNSSGDKNLKTSYSTVSQLLEASVFSENTGEMVQNYVTDFTKNSIHHICPRLQHVNKMIRDIQGSEYDSALTQTLIEVLQFGFEECPETFVQGAGIEGFVNLFKLQSSPDTIEMVKEYIQEGRLEGQLGIEQCGELEKIEGLRDVVLESREKYLWKERIFLQKNTGKDIILNKRIKPLPVE